MDALAITAVVALALALIWLAWEVRTLHRDAAPLIALADSPTARALGGLSGAA